MSATGIQDAAPGTPGSERGPFPSSSGGVSLLSMIGLLYRSRRIILISAGIGLAVAAVVAIVRPSTYTTSVSFMPQSSGDQAPGGFANIAGQFGISLGSLGQQEPPQLYADLLMTREVLAPIAADSFVVDSVGTRQALADFLDVEGDSPELVIENTMRAIRRRVVSTTVALRTTGMVTVNVRTKSPLVSHQIAEDLLARLNHFNLVTRQSQAREERRFTEQRLEEARDSLRAAEDRLQSFLQRNRDVDRSPSLRFENERLQRQSQMQEQVVSSLSQKYEENRIREVRDTPVITVFEPPVRAVRADPGLRAVILVLGLAIGLFVGVVAVFARDAWRREVGSLERLRTA